jgi:hypothetical protein
MKPDVAAFLILSFSLYFVFLLSAQEKKIFVEKWQNAKLKCKTHATWCREQIFRSFSHPLVWLLKRQAGSKVKKERERKKWKYKKIRWIKIMEIANPNVEFFIFVKQSQLSMLKWDHVFCFLKAKTICARLKAHIKNDNDRI